MKFSHKIGKLFSKSCWTSVAYHTEQIYLNMKLAVQDRVYGSVQTEFVLTPENILRHFDGPQFKEIQKQYGTTEPTDDNRKYISWPLVWLEKNINRIRAVGLQSGIKKNVLDIGCGVGYFLYICGKLGHRAIGLDLDDDDLFRKMIALLGVERRIVKIDAFVPLPDFGIKFDLVTAHLVCFNGHKNYAAPLWTPKEWRYFLTNLCQHLNPDAEVYFELNCEFDGTFMTPELRAWFENVIHAKLSASGRNVHMKHSVLKESLAREAALVAK